MHRVKFNDYAELLSDDLNNNNAYLYNGLITTISDFIAANDCVSGLEVTAQAVPDMTVYVKSGRIYQNGYQGLLEADLTTPLTIAPASASQPRIDLICAKYEEVEDEPEIRNVMTDVVSRNITQVEVKTRIASSIAFQVVGGTAAAEPTVPTTPEGWVALAKVTVPANASVIQQSNIVDMRPEIINIYQHDHSGGANGAKLDYNNLNNLPDLSDFTGATAEAAGKRGMVPAPAAGDQNKALFGDKSYKSVVQSVNGIMPDAGGGITLVTGINMLARNQAYQYGDIAYSNNLPSWAYLFCVTAGTTAASEPSFSGVNSMGQYITDGTVKWIVDDIRFNTPVGVVFYDSYLHAGCVKYNGATVQRSDYIRIAKIATDENLWTESPSTEPWKFGVGDGSTTMVLPDFRKRFIEGSDNVGIINAGLPNITGGFNANLNISLRAPNVYGAFSRSALQDDQKGDNGHNMQIGQYSFNAANSNSIYGASTTVQPPAITLLPQIKF